jgi:predicted DNA-binding protein (UPF0251 family)
MSRAKDIILTTEQIEHYQKYIKERVDIQEDRCWFWNKALTEHKYGIAHLDNPKRNVRAHRLAYAAFNGGVLKALNDEGKQLVVRHQCNNPPCANPEHLLIGTKQENSNDMIVAGRVMYGEKHPRAKYTEEQVKGVIESKGQMTREERAEKFGVSLSIVVSIDYGNSWVNHPARDADFQPPPKKARPERPQELQLDIIQRTYHRILEKCVLSAEPNKHTNTKCLLWTGCISDGYGVISIGPHHYRTHHIAWMFKTGRTFIPEGMVVRHLCGSYLCSNESHVEIGTPYDNTMDQLRMGVHGHAILTEADVKEVWRLYDEGLTLTDIAKQFGVIRQTVSAIVNGLTWKHVSADQPVSKRMIRKFTDDEIREIRRLYAISEVSQMELAVRYGVSKGTISGIVNRKVYKKVTDISPPASDPQSTSPSPSQPDPSPPTTVLEGTGIDQLATSVTQT